MNRILIFLFLFTVWLLIATYKFGQLERDVEQLEDCVFYKRGCWNAEETRIKQGVSKGINEGLI